MTDGPMAPYVMPELLDQLGDAVTVVDADWVYRYVSPAASVIIGRPVEECVGTSVWDLFPEVVGTPQHEAVERAMTSRTRERFVWYFDTVARWYEQFAIPVGTGLVVVVNDITEQQHELSRSARLVEIGEALANTVSVDDVNTAVVTHALPAVGAVGGSIVLADEERRVMNAVRWLDLDDRLNVEWAEYPIDRVTPATEAYRTGAPVYVVGLDDARARFPGVVDELVRLGRQSVAALPLVSAGTRIGALALTFPDERALDVGDARYLSTTAAMVAQAVLRARLLDAERRSLSALQHSLLPHDIMQPPGLDIAVRYEAGHEAVEVGGDWFDVVPLGGGAVGLVMGDIEGHDIGAAAAMGLVRSAVRAYASEGHPPAVVLARTNEFVAQLPLGRIVTVSYAQLHPLERLITTVSAGHPGVQVVEPGGRQYEVPSEIGPPLGVFDDGLLWAETTSTIAPESVLVTFTDGLVEERGHDIDDGFERVRATLLQQRHDDVGTLADALLALRVGRSHDDVALLVARLTAPSDVGRTLTRRLPATPASVFLARRFTRQLLAEWDVAGDRVEVAELVMSELTTNAARHSDDSFQVGLSCEDRLLRLEVGDDSHRLPVVADEDDEVPTGGRGLVLVETLADRWGVESTGLGKVVWAEFDLE